MPASQFCQLKHPNTLIFPIFVPVKENSIIFCNLNKSTGSGKLIKILLIVVAALVIVFLVIVISFGRPGSKTGGIGLPDASDSGILFAHRGVVADFPENSLESIAEAKRLGFRAVEFDLRKSANGDFILFHDTDCSRMLGTDFEIQDVPTTDLKTFPFIYKGKTTPWFVPTLKEVLDRHYADFTFYFDMKLSGFKEADQIVEIIRKYGIEKQVIVASADAVFAIYIEYKYPEINTALEGMNAGKEWMYNLIPKKLKPDFLSGFLNRIDEDHVKWLKERNLLNRRIVYGVDSSNYLTANSMGIRNMILDYYPTSPVFNDIRFMNH
jgi:glycerophosphoryl diester phosphodiesterase